MAPSGGDQLLRAISTSKGISFQPPPPRPAPHRPVRGTKEKTIPPGN